MISDVGVWVRDAPGTYIWLAALLGTTWWISRQEPEQRARIHAANSTSLARLRRAPLVVLVTSAFFIASGSWPLYAFLFTVFQAPAEHMLGTGRWLAVIAITHVGATLLSQGHVAEEVRRERLPRGALTADDYGVSYGMAGAVGVLAYRFAMPWRLVYLAVVLVYYGRGLAKARDFTALGHLCAVLLGLGCYFLVP